MYQGLLKRIIKFSGIVNACIRLFSENKIVFCFLKIKLFLIIKKYFLFS